MTPHEALAIIATLKYKKGYLIAAETDAWTRGLRIDMTAVVDDSGQIEGRSIRLNVNFVMSGDDLASMDRELFLRFLFEELVMRFERHEAKEWFRIDGVPVFPPEH